jgi:hypothetical protein
MKKTLQPIIIAIIACIFSGLFFSYWYNRNEKKDYDCQINILRESIDQKKYFIHGLYAFLFSADDELTIKMQTEEIYEILQIYDKIIAGMGNSKQIKNDLDAFVGLINYNQTKNRNFGKIEELFSSMNNQDESDITHRIMLTVNYILDEFIGTYIYSTYPVSELEIVNVARQDTVKYGEYYESQILYDILDLTMEKMIVIDNKDTLYNGYYREHALSRGKNKREGKQYFVFKDMLQILDFEIEYFVE